MGSCSGMIGMTRHSRVSRVNIVWCIWPVNLLLIRVFLFFLFCFIRWPLYTAVQQLYAYRSGRSSVRSRENCEKKQTPAPAHHSPRHSHGKIRFTCVWMESCNIFVLRVLGNFLGFFFLPPRFNYFLFFTNFSFAFIPDMSNSRNKNISLQRWRME